MAQALVPVFASPYVVERPRLALILLRMLLLGTSRLQGDAEVSPALLDGLLHYALHDMAVLRQAARRVWVVMRVPLASYVPTAPATLPAMAQSRRRGSGNLAGGGAVPAAHAWSPKRRGSTEGVPPSALMSPTARVVRVQEAMDTSLSVFVQ